MHRACLSWTAAVLTIVAFVAIGASPAAAHSFLATTRPAQGERLPSPPREVALQLSEPVEADTAELAVTDEDGAPVEAGKLEFDSGGAVVRVPLVSPSDGLYRVSWHVVSAVDGHESAGEFSFAVGDDATFSGADGGSTGGTRVSPLATAATWLLLAGWSVAFGAAALAARARGLGIPGRPATWVRAGTVVALAGLGVRAGVGTGDRAVTVVALAGMALAAALVLARAPRVWPSTLALGAFAAIWPARGHASTTALGWLLDSVHLLAAGVWVGGLTVVLVALGVAVRAGRPADALPVVRLYARSAVVAVVVLIASGVALGWSLVPSLGSILTDDYGRLVAAKSALLSVAVGAALVARRRLARGEADRVRRTVRPEYASLAIAVLVAALLVDTPPRPPTVETLLGPPPIEGPVSRVAGMAGHITLDVQAGHGRLDVNARGPSGGIDAELVLTALLPDGTELDLHPRPCGIGCATLRLELPPGETLLVATAEADDWTGGSLSLPLRWPPEEEDPALFDRMRDAMSSVDRVFVAEEAGADPPPTARGARVRGQQLVGLMPWGGGGVTDVRPVGDEPDRFTFYLPGSFMWFDVTVDEQGHLLTQQLVNPGHDIRYRFTYPADGADSPSP